jgi:hypothetical protein
VNTRSLVSAAVLAAALAALAAPVRAGGGHAHEHGVTHLDIVVDGGRVALRLQAAGHHIVGFEHAPESAAQHAAWAAAEAALADASALFQPDAEAACRAVSAAVTPPGGGKAAHGQAHGHQHHGHAHADHADDDGHGHGGDWHADYRFECAAPERLRGIRHALFRAFPGTEEVRWQLLAPTGQDGGVLRAGQDRIAVPRAR